jgi:hypothetical protein
MIRYAPLLTTCECDSVFGIGCKYMVHSFWGASRYRPWKLGFAYLVLALPKISLYFFFLVLVLFSPSSLPHTTYTSCSCLLLIYFDTRLPLYFDRLSRLPFPRSGLLSPYRLSNHLLVPTFSRTFVSGRPIHFTFRLPSCVQCIFERTTSARQIDDRC